MTLAIISNNISTDSARELAKALKCKYINLQNTKKRSFLEFDWVFKYGVSKKIEANNVLNTSKATTRAIDKIQTFKTLANDNITIEYTESIEEARNWIDQGFIVVARKVATGANGDGLSYCTNQQQLTDTPAIFWTKFFFHTNEFRVNIWKGKVISIYEKTRQKTHFKFTLWQGQEEHPQLQKIATSVWKNIKLDWCGIDLLRDNQGNLKIIEVNSAPVLYPFTIKKLAKHILQETQNA